MDLIFVTRKKFFFVLKKSKSFLITSFLCFLLVGVAECKRSCKQSAKSFSVNATKRMFECMKKKKMKRKRKKKTRKIGSLEMHYVQKDLVFLYKISPPKNILLQL